MNIRHLPFHLGLSFALAICGVVSAILPAQAQRGNFSDVTGTIVTTSDAIGGGSNPGGGGQLETVFISGRVENAVNGAADLVTQQLAAGNLPVVATGAPTAIPAAVQQNLQVVVTATGNVDAVSQLQTALVNAGADPTLAGNLASSLQGLTAGGTVDPAQFRAAIEAYNALINASTPDFLVQLPEELRAVQSLLATLLNAGYASR